MKVVRIVLADGIRWNVSQSDPKSIPLRFLEGIRLVNPLVPVGAWAQPLVASLGNGAFHVHTDCMTLAAFEDFFAGDLVDRLGPFVHAIRIASRQASLLDRVVATASYSTSRLPRLRQPVPSFARGELFGSYRIKTALTLDLARAVARRATGSPSFKGHRRLHHS